MTKLRDGVAIAVLLAVVFTLAALPAAAARSAAPSGPIDINTASQKVLESLPGVGAATAKKIIAGRPYASVADLAKAGISKKTIEKITPLVTVSGGGAATSAASSMATTPTRRTARKSVAAATAGSALIDLNTASQKELESLPGIGAATAKKIIAGRPYASVADLAKAGVRAKTVEKITPLVTAGGAAAAATSLGTQSPFSLRHPTGAASSAGTASGAAATTSATGGATAQAPPVAGMVWVNLSTKVYHYAGDRWYGKTKNGKFMSEQDAIAAGYRAAKSRSAQPKTQTP